MLKVGQIYFSYLLENYYITHTYNKTDNKEYYVK